MASSSTTTEKSSRRAIRWGVACLVAVMVLDVLPWGLLPDDRPKQWLNPLIGRAGMWQSQWTMFTPRPQVNHFWMTANVQDADGQSLEDYSSPYWPTVGTWEKFVGFRYVNYFNRLSLPKNRVATRDFAEYLSRTLGPRNVDEPAEPVRIELYLNNVQMDPPSDGKLPPKDEIGWIMQSQLLETVDPFAAEPETGFEIENIWTVP